MTDLTQAEAESSVTRAKRGLEAAADEIVTQITGRAWLALGYSSWDEMREAEYGGAAVIVPRADRPELSARLAAEGLSQQEVGDTLGVDQRTVGRDMSDVRQMPNEESESRTDSLGREQPRTKTRDPGKVTDTTRTTETTKVERDVDLATGEIDPEPEPGPVDPSQESPAAVAARAMREARNSPSSVFSTKLLKDLKLWGDWFDLAEVGGPEGVLDDLWQTPIEPAEQAESWRYSLASARAWIDRMDTAIEARLKQRMRRVK